MSSQKIKKISERILGQGNWLTLIESTYLDGDQEIKWESVQRKDTSFVIAIIAKLVPSQCYVLIKQYKWVIEKHIIGFPAGIHEEGDIEDTVYKELKEETGYVGTIVKRSPVFYVNPGLWHEKMQMFYVDIDENKDENKNPIQNLEPAEKIDVILKTANEIPEFIAEQQGDDCIIGAGVWTYFERLLDK